MSTIPHAHTLIATATDDIDVKLCDLSSGASTHSLKGHTSGISTLAWSPLSQNLLVTGSYDQSIRIWDIRRSGSTACLMTLNQYTDHHHHDDVKSRKYKYKYI